MIDVLRELASRVGLQGLPVEFVRADVMQAGQVFFPGCGPCWVCQHPAQERCVDGKGPLAAVFPFKGISLHQGSRSK